MFKVKSHAFRTDDGERREEKNDSDQTMMRR